MTTEECLLRAICREVLSGGILTDRFTELWLASGVNLEGHELDIANKLLQRAQEVYGSILHGAEHLN